MWITHSAFGDASLNYADDNAAAAVVNYIDGSVKDWLHRASTGGTYNQYGQELTTVAGLMQFDLGTPNDNRWSMSPDQYNRVMARGDVQAAENSVLALGAAAAAGGSNLNGDQVAAILIQLMQNSPGSTWANIVGTGKAVYALTDSQINAVANRSDVNAAGAIYLYNPTAYYGPAPAPSPAPTSTPTPTPAPSPASAPVYSVTYSDDQLAVVLINWLASPTPGQSLNDLMNQAYTQFGITNAQMSRVLKRADVVAALAVYDQTSDAFTPTPVTDVSTWTDDKLAAALISAIVQTPGVSVAQLRSMAISQYGLLAITVDRIIARADVQAAISKYILKMSPLPGDASASGSSNYLPLLLAAAVAFFGGH